MATFFILFGNNINFAVISLYKYFLIYTKYKQDYNLLYK